MNPVRDCYISSRESRNNIMKQEQKISNGVKKITLFIFLLLLAGLVLIGGSCGKGENGEAEGSKLPAFCVDKPAPKDFPEDLFHPAIKSKEIIEIGMSDEVSGAGWEGYQATFCADVSKDEVLEWYRDKLESEGYSFYVYEGEEVGYMWQKDKQWISLDLTINPIEGYLLFTLGIQNWN